MVLTCDRCTAGPVDWRLLDDDGDEEYNLCAGCALMIVGWIHGEGDDEEAGEGRK